MKMKMKKTPQKNNENKNKNDIEKKHQQVNNDRGTATIST
jgi:hypothetical protein